MVSKLAPVGTEIWMSGMKLVSEPALGPGGPPLATATQVSVTVSAVVAWTLPSASALGSRISRDESAESLKVTVTP